MRGYLAITNDRWYSSIKKNGLESCVFWRKKSSFRALLPGDSFYFAGKRSPDGDRYLVGKSSFNRFELINAKAAWDKYNVQLGSIEEKDFLDLIERFYKNTDIVLGCIILKKPTFLQRPCTLSSLGVNFSQYIVSGRIVDEDECGLLDGAFQEE